MADYMPHTPEEVEQMLAFLGLSTEAELFDVVPEAIRLAGGLNLAPGITEPDVLDRFEQRAANNRARADQLVCFAGAGAYDHELPPVVKMLGSRSEFVTAYTPYQPEIAQGVLQAIFEFQTMTARIFGLPVANASLYDGATALVEAVNLAVASAKNSRVVLSSGVHPHWRQVVETFAVGTGHEIEVAPLVDGRTDFSAIDGPCGAIVVAQPNYLGGLEHLDQVRALCDRTGALMIVAADPVASGLLKTPGSYGADVVVGEGQGFGTALSFGGPYLGLFACTLPQIRRLPGRIVGETVDTTGTKAYVTTLRTREQDIRREKATSNVCTNQTLMAVAAAIQLSWLGTAGLTDLALRCAQGTRYLIDQLGAGSNTSVLHPNLPVFRDVAIRTAASASVVIERMADEGFLAGIAASALLRGSDPSLSPSDHDHTLLVSVTERRTAEQIDRFAAALEKAGQK